MKNISINQTIGTLSAVTQYILVMLAAILLSKSIWWVANPLGYDTYDNILSKNFDSAKLAQTIINRAPFGMVTEEKAPIPTIADQIKVVGVYAGGPNNSIAFLSINGKNSIAVIGDSVLNGKVKAITPNGVIFFSQNQDVTINLSTTSGGSNGGSTNNNSSHPPVPSNNSSNNNGYIPSNTSTNNQAQSSNNQSNQTQSSQSDNNAGNDNDSIADKRRKMIEAFQKQNSTGNDNANNGQQN